MIALGPHRVESNIFKDIFLPKRLQESEKVCKFDLFFVKTDKF